MNRLNSLVRLILGFTLMSVAALVFIPVCVVLLPSRKARILAGNLYGKFVGSSIAWLARAKVVIHNRERLTQGFPAIYVSNHTSTLDVFVGMWLCPYGGCGVAKREIARVPFFGWLYWLSGHLLIDRGNRENAIAALKGVAEDVHRLGLGVWMWPEGTRSKDGRLRPFKKGVGHLALATGLPIIPVVIHDAHKNWEKHRFQFNPLTIHVEVLSPIPTRDWTLDGLDEHLRAVHDQMAAVLGPDQRPLPEQEAP